MTDITPTTTLMQLVRRSRMLGEDRSICNWGGGNVLNVDGGVAAAYPR